jgi:predicted RNA binding protein YcfA (HicA-like mRNA interferase family)
MKGGIPAVTGNYLIELLEFDGWIIHGRSTHGVTLKKIIDGQNKVTTVPTKKGSMPDGTLGSILGVKQT